MTLLTRSNLSPIYSDKSNKSLINNSAELSENWAAVTISELLGTEVTRELEGVFLRENVNCAEQQQQQQQQKDDNNIKILHDAVCLRDFYLFFYFFFFFSHFWLDSL